jgi:hypothetical protein
MKALIVNTKLTWIVDELIKAWRKQMQGFRGELEVVFLGHTGNEFCAVGAGPVREIEEPLESTLQTDVLGQHQFHVVRISGDDDDHSLVLRVGHCCHLCIAIKIFKGYLHVGKNSDVLA